MERVKLVDNRVKDELLRYPTAELIRKLFPDRHFAGRSLFCNPLRDDRHPSLSCFRDRAGYMRWKDHATGESGDNIDFFRRVYPELSYVEAIERLSELVLGRSALREVDPSDTVRLEYNRRVSRPYHVPVVEEPSALQVVSAVPFVSSRIPSYLVDYSRSRAVSDQVASSYLWHVVYDNVKLKGRSVIDPESGLPVMDENGEIIRHDGRFEALGFRNDIGGFSLRVPDSQGAKGFKGSNVSFISTLLAGGAVPSSQVRFVGRGDGYVSGFGYDEGHRYLSVNQTQGFIGVEPYAVRAAAVFLDTWNGRYIEGKDLLCCEAILTSLNCPASKSVSVVEGMFDGLSRIEIDFMSGNGPRPVNDLVVLNSTSNYNWAVPFLAVHSEVHCLLDNDMRSAAGAKVFDVLKDRIASFVSRAGLDCRVVNDSGLFFPSKDLNDYLVVKKSVRPSAGVDSSKVGKEAVSKSTLKESKPVHKGRKAPIRESKNNKSIKP